MFQQGIETLEGRRTCWTCKWCSCSLWSVVHYLSLFDEVASPVQLQKVQEFQLELNFERSYCIATPPGLLVNCACQRNAALLEGLGTVVLRVCEFRCSFKYSHSSLRSGLSRSAMSFIPGSHALNFSSNAELRLSTV